LHSPALSIRFDPHSSFFLCPPSHALPSRSHFSSFRRFALQEAGTLQTFALREAQTKLNLKKKELEDARRAMDEHYQPLLQLLERDIEEAMVEGNAAVGPSLTVAMTWCKSRPSVRSARSS